MSVPFVLVLEAGASGAGRSRAGALERGHEQMSKESGVEVIVHFEAQLRNIAGTGQAKISLPEASSVVEALRIVAAKFGPALGERLLTADEKPQRSILLFVNDQGVAHDQAQTHQLKSGDTLLLYPPISGG